MNMINAIQPRGVWDGDDKPAVGDGSKWQGWLSEHIAQFNGGVEDLKAKLKDAMDALDDDPGSAAAAAAYQAAVGEYTMYRTIQSNSAKTLADMQKQNIRNIA